MVTPRINEVFGPTFQGEGPMTGRRCSFIRFALCNLTCTWCDTPYTWDWTGKNGTAYNKTIEVNKRTNIELVAELATHKTDMAVLTGGEPLLQTKAHQNLVNDLLDAGYQTIQTETNGTLKPAETFNQPDSRIHWSVSPKLASAGMSDTVTIKPDALNWFNTQPNTTFKFVVANQTDVQQAMRIVTDFDIKPDRVWFMPEGTTAQNIETALPEVAAAALSNGVQLSTRLHVSTWGDKRGV